MFDPLAKPGGPEADPRLGEQHTAHGRVRAPGEYAEQDVNNIPGGPLDSTESPELVQDQFDTGATRAPGDADDGRPLERRGANDLPQTPLLHGGAARKRRVLQRRDATVPQRVGPEHLTPAQRLLLLDVWRRSELPAGDFAALVGVCRQTLFAWKHRFDTEGPGGLVDQPRGAPKGSQLPELTRRTILMLKQNHPDWGCQRISDMLLRGPALPASPGAVARVLAEAGYEVQEEPTKPHPDHVRHFERARANQLWQTDLFTKEQT
jgi:hypothetical protein